MIQTLYETAAFYGAPLSVQPFCHHDLRTFVESVLKEGESRLKNLLPFILAKQAGGRQDIRQAFVQWASQDSAFQTCWEFTQLALRQLNEVDWNVEDRDRWRQLCKEVSIVGVEPERALANLRRFLNTPA